MNIFSIDSKFSRFVNLVADMILLGLMWMCTSIPIVTLGASTTALYYVMTKRICNKEGYLFKDYFKSFKANFIQSTIIWIMLLLILIPFLFDFFWISGDFSLYTLPFKFALLIQLLIITVFIFPIISRFEMPTKQLIKTSFFMANKHLATSILCIAALILTIVICYLYPPFVVASVGFYCYVSSILLVKVFKKYNPEIDKDPEDILPLN